MAATITGDRGSMDPGEGMNNYCHNSIQSVGIDVSFTDLLNMVAKDAEMSKYPVDGSSQLNEEMLLGGGEDILVEKSISDIETRTGANMEDGIWDGNVNFSMESSPYSQKPTLIEGNLSLVHNYQMNQSEQAVSLTVPLTVHLVAAPTLFRTLLCQELFPISSWPKMVELWMLRRMPGNFLVG